MNRIKVMISAVRDFWIDHLWFDAAVAGVLLIAHMVLVWLLPAVDLLGNALPADRRSAYSSAAIVVSLLGSFSSVAISQLSAAKGARADALRQQGAKDLARSWRSVFRVGMIAAVVAILCLLVDPSVVVVSVVPVVARWAFEYCVFLATMKFLRLSALFFEVITLASRGSEPEMDDGRAPALTVVPGWAGKHNNAS